ncbi:MAG: hypothetical protein JST00_42970 [Deltaproteobacteria bacterium]|nr:hypothetical protein [Deltaproteobacteria bacterium]
MTLEPLDDDLRLLLEREREAYPSGEASAHAAEAALRRFEVTVAFAALTGATALATAAAAGGAGAAAGAGASAAAAAAARAALVKKIAVASVIAFAAGFGAGEVHRAIAPVTIATAPPAPSTARVEPPSTAPSTAGTTTPTPSALAPSSLPDAPLPTPSAPIAQASATSSIPSPSASSAASSPSDLGREQALIDTARAALARGNGQGALAAAREHEARFPRGRLAEDRELVIIQALESSGQHAAAVERAERFRKAYPASLYLPAVEAIRGKDAGR